MRYDPLQMMLNQMIQSDPRARQAMQMLQGKSPRELEQMARNMAKERGVSIEDVMRQLGLGR